MKTRSSRPGRAALAVAALCMAVTAVPGAAGARDREFGLLVHHIESHYQAKRAHRFLIGFAGGFANVVIRFWRPYGVKNFKLAMFEHQDLSASRNDPEFPRVVRAGLKEDWQPLVQSYSRRNGERTYVFAKAQGKYVKFLVATLEQDEAVVVQVSVNPDRLSQGIDQWATKPNETAESVRAEARESESD